MIVRNVGPSMSRVTDSLVRSVGPSVSHVTDIVECGTISVTCDL